MTSNQEFIFKQKNSTHGIVMIVTDKNIIGKKFENEKLVFEKHIELDISKKAIIRPYNFTFNPEIWDRESLYIATHNGGSTLEKFNLKGQNISHGDIYSSLISACHGFGNTEGVFIVGDVDKSITFECNMSVSALIPSIFYKEMDGTYFFRLQYSVREMDETLKIGVGLNIFHSKIKIYAA